MQLTFENNKFHFATIQTPGPRLKLDHNSENRNWSEFFHTFAAFTPENFIKSIFGSIAFLKKSQADHALRWPLRSGRVNSICNFIHKVWNSNETSGGYQNFHSRPFILIFFTKIFVVVSIIKYRFHPQTPFLLIGQTSFSLFSVFFSISSKTSESLVWIEP